MSVVNKMLQDLEARKTTPDVVGADYVPPAQSSSKIWYMISIILLLAVTAYLWFIGPQWPQNDPVSSDRLNVKTQTNQSNSQAEEKLILEKDVNSEEARIDLRAAQIAKEDRQSTSNTPLEATKILTSSQSNTTNLVPVSNTQQLTEASTNEFLAQSSNKYVVEDVSQEKAQAKSSFSISDSSNKDKAAGAKQGVINALSEGDSGLAIRRLEELLRVQPENIEARKKLAELLFAQKRSNQAAQVLQQGVNKHPMRSDLRLMLARLYMQKKDHNAAIELLNEIQPQAANQLEYLAYRAALLQQNGHYQPAMVDYIKLLAADSSNAKWWLGLAITQERLGQTSEALSAYRNANDKEQLSPSVVNFVKQRIMQIEGAQ